MRDLAAITVVAFIGLGCNASMAQSAAFRCANPGTIIEFSDSTRVTWGQAEANRCQINTRLPDALV